VLVDRRTFLKLVGATGAIASGASLAAEFVAPGIVRGQTAAGQSEIGRLVSALGYDVERIHRFVSDEIRYEPYVGVLRGAEATLSGRAGNSADQALLLAAMLDASQVSYRFALGAIDTAVSEAVMASSGRDAAGARADLVEAWQGGGVPREADPQPSPENQRLLDEAERSGPPAVAWARDELSRTIDTIETALGNAGVSLPPGFTDMPDRERREHVWLQIAWGPGWLDLDPTLPGVEPGVGLATAAATMAALPEEVHHRIRLAVIEEHIAAGSLEQQDLLVVEGLASEIGGKAVLFLNAEPEGLTGVGIEIAAGLEGRTVYFPSLSVGEDSHISAMPISFGSGKGVFDAGVDTAQEGETTAQWLDLTILSPDAEPITVRRAVFDRVGTSARADGRFDATTLPTAELVELVPGTRQDFLPAQSVHWLTVNNGILGGDALRSAFQPTDQLATMAGLIHTYHLVHEAAGVEVALPVGVRLFADAPNVVAMIAETESQSDGTPGIRLGLDILHRSQGQLPVTGAAASVPPATAAGILSHVAERIMLGDGSTGPSARSSVPSVGAIFEQARRDGIDVRAIVDPESADGLAYPPDALARLRQSLGAGWIAVVPAHSVNIGDQERVGWWLIDPATGRCADEMDDGRGGGSPMGGRVVIHVRTVAAQPSMLRLGACIVGGMGLSLALLGTAWGAVNGSPAAIIGGGTAAGGGAGLIAGCVTGAI
jgi:hypothetical protein